MDCDDDDGNGNDDENGNDDATASRVYQKRIVMMNDKEEWDCEDDDKFTFLSGYI